jgi:flagellar L-ring protein FlgH
MKIRSNRVIFPVLMLAMATLSGCGMTRASQRPPVQVAVVQPTSPDMLTMKKGSIWQSSDRNTLFLDNKARNIGDIIAVEIEYNSSAGNTEASVNLSRTNTIPVEVAESGVPGLNDAAKLLGLTNAILGGTHEFTSDNDNSRSSFMNNTRISCLITEVLPNGNLRIEGRTDVTINYENEFILFSGIVRPEDIGQDNTIRSQQVADLRIDFSGDGDIDDQMRPSWVHRLLSTINIL